MSRRGDRLSEIVPGALTLEISASGNIAWRLASQAMWRYERRSTLRNGRKLPARSPHVYQEAGISVIRATALTGTELDRAVGGFKNNETLTR